MPFNPGVSFHGDQYAFQGITGAANAISGGLLQALNKYEEDKKQREFNTGLLDTFKSDPNSAKYVPVEALQKWDSLNSDKQAGYIAGITRRMSTDMQRQQQQSTQDVNAAHTDLLQAQAHNEWAGGGAADQPLQLTDEEKANYEKSGKIPVRTTAKSFQAVDMPEVPAAPDLGNDGNPIFTKDGTMYRSKGVFKPVTGPMMQAKQAWDMMHTASDQAKAAAKKPGFNLFDTSTWGGGKAAQPALPTDPGTTPGAPSLMPTTAAPVTVSTPAEAAALPAGTRYQTPDGKVYIR